MSDATMTFVDADPAHGFTITDNDFLNAPGISWKATALLIYLKGRPPGWSVRPSQLAKVKTDGRDSVLSGLRELIEAGYVHRTQKRDAESGQITEVAYEFSWHKRWPQTPCSGPGTDFPDTGLPDTAPPDQANPPVVSTEVEQLLSEQSPPDLASEAAGREPDPIALGISQLLASHIEQAGLWKWKRAMPVVAWSADIEKLIRLDEVDPSDLMDFIDWLYTDDGSATARFWRTQVLSGANLRKHRPMIEMRREWEAGETERKRVRQTEMDARFGTKPHVAPEQSQHPANKAKGRLPAWFWEQTFETLADLELEASNYGLSLDEALAMGGKSRADFAA